MQRGVVCWVSYKRTESCVATAYTIRYGRENVGFGPGVEALVSVPADDLEDVPGFSGSGPADVGGGGGSMTVDVGLETGSGSAGMGSSDEDVSIVICLVAGGACLSV